MVKHLPPIVIARRDYARLERLADDALRGRHPVGRFLMSEIRRAAVLETNKMPEGVACLNESVTYRVDGSSNFRGANMLALRGYALFGRDAGRRGRSYGSHDMVHVLDIDPRIARRCLHAGRL